MTNIKHDLSKSKTIIQVWLDINESKIYVCNLE